MGEETVTSEFLVISYNDKVATRKLKTPEFLQTRILTEYCNYGVSKEDLKDF